MYTIELYSRDFSTKLSTLFFGDDFFDFSYTKEINKPGGCKFSMELRNEKSTPSNLSVFNRIIVKKGLLVKFQGYIESLQMDLNTIELECVGMLGYFKKRLQSVNFSSTTAPTVIYALLSNTNSEDDTGISQGTSTVSTVVTDLKFERSNVLSAWQKVANLAGAEFEINADLELDIKPTLGADKTASVVLQYSITQIDSANITEFYVEIEGKDMANKVTGIRNGGSTTTLFDNASITAFGLLEEAKNFSQTDDSGDLNNEVQNYLDYRKEEFYTPKITVNLQKIDIENFQLGDTIKLKMNNGFINLDRNDRIVKLEIRLNKSGQETLDINLTPETINLLPSPFLDGMLENEKRISLLEGGL